MAAAAVAVAGLEEEMLGVNSRAHLAEAEGVFQRRARDAAMAGGATMIDPATVWLSHDTVIGRDVLIEPNVFFGPGVVIANDVVIHANSHLEGASVDEGAELGPYARLVQARTSARMPRSATSSKSKTPPRNRRQGQPSRLHRRRPRRRQSQHGAGTIFCNYDGFFKHKTDVGAGAFIGSNSSLVAPLRSATAPWSAQVASSHVKYRPDSLALARAVQETREGWSAKFRAMMTKKKSQSGK